MPSERAERRQFSKSFWITIAMIVVFWLVYYPYSPGGRQRRDQRIARPFAEALNEQFSSDLRFHNVSASTTTHVQVRIHGTILPEHIDDLKELIESRRALFDSLPPIKVELDDQSKPGDTRTRVITLTFDRK